MVAFAKTDFVYTTRCAGCMTGPTLDHDPAWPQLSCREGRPVTPGVASCTVHMSPIFHMAADDLASAEQTPSVALDDLDRVPERFQLVRHLRADAFFQVDGRIEHFADVRHPRTDAYPWCIQRRLRVVLESQHVHQHLDVPLWLHEPSHDAVHRVQTLIAGVGDHGRYNGVIWALLGCDHVRMTFLEDEVGPPVLQGETTSLRNDACAEATVVAVDERHTIAVFVGDGEVDGVAMVMSRRAVMEGARRFLGVENLGTLR